MGLETAGIGAFVLANSPAIMSLIGGSARDLIKHTNDMREITVTLNERFSIPILDFQGIPTGIDIRKVIKTGILPVTDSAITHKKAGVGMIGMIGAGLVNPPLEVFMQALHTFNQRYKLYAKSVLLPPLESIQKRGLYSFRIEVIYSGDGSQKE